MPILGTVFILLFSSYLILQSPVVQTYLTQKVAKYLSQKYHTTISVKGISVAFFNKVVLEDVLIKDQQQDSLLFVHELQARIDSFSVKKRFVSIGKLTLDKTFVSIGSDSTGRPNYQFLLDAFKTSDAQKTDTLKNAPKSFSFLMNQFDFSDARIKYAYRDSLGTHQICLDDIILGGSDVVLQDEKMALKIDRFKLNDQKTFKLEDFSAEFISTSDSVFLNKLHVRTADSEITEANIRVDKSKLGPESDLKKLKVFLDLKKSVINLKDIAQVVPSMKGMDENVMVSGQISGKMADLKGKNIEIGFGNNTRLAFDFYMNGLPDIDNTYMHLDLKQSFADLVDIQNVKFPDDLSLRQLNIPASLLQAGVIEYNGNFTGFLSDFVAYGTFRSRYGVLTTDLSFVPSEKENLKINGRVKTVNFQVGELLQAEQLNRITFNGNIQGKLNRFNHDLTAKVSGQIDSVDVSGYQYRNIQLNGDVQNEKFDGSLLVDDPNLKFRFDGQFDLNVPVPVFNFNMLVEKADLKALKLDHTFNKSEVAFDLNANFTGNNIDNLNGNIHFKEGSYQNENGTLDFNGFDLRTFNENEPVLQIRSDFLDADIRGQYQLHNLPNTVEGIIAKYLPSAGVKAPVQQTRNNFDYRFVLKDINRFTRVLSPDLKINPAKIEGNINSNKNTLVLNATFPQIQYQSTVLQNVVFNVNADSKLNVRNKIDEISAGESFKIYNMALISEADNDVMDSKLSWNNFGEVSYSGSLSTSTKFFSRNDDLPHVEISVKPTRLYLADNLWQIHSSLITVDSTLVKVNDLKLSNNGQSVTVDGSIEKGQNNKLNVYFNRFDLNSLNTFIGEDLDLKGELNGSVSFFDLYQRPLFLSDLRISGLDLLGQSIGDASVRSKWDRTSEELNAELLVESGGKKTLEASGIYNPGHDSLSINTNFDHFSILILQPLMGSSFANFHGDATGKVRISGPMNHIRHNGALYAANAGLMVSQLQVNYNLNDSVRFAGDKIIFPDMKVLDDYGNTGVFFGSIQHQSFSKMVYDLTIKSDRIMAINTTPQVNGQFYGKAFGSGVVRITGKGATVLIDGVARTEKGTDMNILLEYEDEAQEYDFLRFVSRGYQPRQISKEVPSYESDVQMKFYIDITPEAKAQLIYNSKIGDVIRSQGSGSMRLLIDNDYNISLFGEYTVEQGDYLFTLQNVINKKFEIQQGGTIEWNGDPYDAILNLNAIYKLKASLSELFANTYENTDLSKRIQVLCKIALSKSLTNPDIKFDIELPTAEDRIKDEVRQFISSDEDMNKQILSLLVLGKFYTPEYLRGTYSATSSNLVGTTASELLSNQFSNWLSQISSDFDIGVNYRPGNEITNDEIELALSTQMFNDRVSINGNIGNNTSQKTNTNNTGLIGDADVNVKLTKNGKLQLKAYNHANNNLIYETSPYTQGVGLSYREDFNDFNELWRKIKSIFGGKKSAAKAKKQNG